MAEKDEAAIQRSRDNHPSQQKGARRKQEAPKTLRSVREFHIREIERNSVESLARRRKELLRITQPEDAFWEERCDPS